VATYNVDNLFDTKYQGSEYKAYLPSKDNWNQAMEEIKLNHVAEVICDIEADIIGLQEIENKAILEKLFTRLEQVGCGYRYYAITHKKGSSIQVALLSTYPITQSHDILANPQNPRGRNILEVEVMIDNHPLLLFVNHWKSRAYHGVESRRVIEAKALQKRISKLSSDREYIILGDLNSDYNSHIALELKLDDTQGLTAFNDILKTYKNGIMIEENQIQKLSKSYHYSLWMELEIEKRWSYKFYGTKSTPDHIVLPPSMFDSKGIDYVNNSFSVLKYGYLFHKKGYINRWQIKKYQHKGKGYSDHLPIYALFDFQPYEKEKISPLSQIPKIQKIESLYQTHKIKNPIILKDVRVLFKRRNNAIIKQSPKGRGIFLYACAKGLKEGYSYDLRIESISNYHGLKEVTTAYIMKEKGLIPTKEYYISQQNLSQNIMKQNEVMHNVTGIVKKGFFLTNGYKIPIHFKKKKFIPKDGTKIKIHYGHLGFYNSLQLVMYNKADFEVLE
jgi:hypothetical protein